MIFNSLKSLVADVGSLSQSKISVFITFWGTRMVTIQGKSYSIPSIQSRIAELSKEFTKKSKKNPDFEKSKAGVWAAFSVAKMYDESLKMAEKCCWLTRIIIIFREFVVGAPPLGERGDITAFFTSFNFVTVRKKGFWEEQEDHFEVDTVKRGNLGKVYYIQPVALLEKYKMPPLQFS